MVRAVEHFAASLISVVMVVVAAIVLDGCASKSLEDSFRPLQIRWVLGVGETDDSMPTKDNCVIRLTAKLMGEAPVQASPVEEIAYSVVYGKSKNVDGTLDFTGACDDQGRMNAPECRWTATCDKDLEVVVKFHNGD